MAGGSDGGTDTVFAFVDTNIFMHFQRVDYVDWCKQLKVNNVVLVLDQQVLKELDDIKDGMKGSTRRDKARSVLAHLKQFLESDTPSDVRPHVSLDINFGPGTFDWEGEGLEYRDQDDRIIASTLAFQRRHPDRSVAIVAGDFSLRMKARQRGIASIDPESFMKRQNLQSDDEKELMQLRRQLTQIQNRTPKLSFGLWHKNELHQNLRLPAGDAPAKSSGDAHIQILIAQEREVLLSEVQDRSQFKDRDVQRYLAECKTYLKELEEHLKFTDILRSSIQIGTNFALTSSNAASHQVTVEITIPDATFVKLLEDRDELIAEKGTRPDPPSAPLTRAVLRLMGPTHYSFSPVIPSLPDIEIPGRPLGTDVETIEAAGQKVTGHVPIVRQGEKKRSERIWIVIPGRLSGGFQMQFVAVSADADKVEGTLHVSFEEEPDQGSEPGTDESDAVS